MRTKCIRATSFSSGKPLADGWPRDAKSLGNGPLRPAFMLQAQLPASAATPSSHRMSRAVVSIPHSDGQEQSNRSAAISRAYFYTNLGGTLISETGADELRLGSNK